jgi:hypothetical protein
MDRREALKKLAIGGTIAAGTSTIVSSPVFAAAGPTIPLATIAIMDHGIDMDGMITATQTAATCMGSADSATATFVSGSFAVTSSDLPIVGSPQTLALDMGVYTSMGITIDSSMEDVVAGDTVTATVTSSFSCLYAGMATTSTCTTTIVATAAVSGMATWSYAAGMQTCT